MRVGLGVAEHERRRRHDLQLAVAAAVPGEPALDVGVEGAPGLQGAVPGEDRVGASAAANSRPSSESPACRITGRPCGLRGTVEPALDVELLRVDAEAAGVGVGEERPRLLVRDDLVAPPRVEQLAGRRPGTPAPGRSACSCGRKPPRRKFSPVNASHEVTTFQPARPAERWSSDGELAGHLVGLVEGRVDRAREAEVVGDGGECGEDREGVGAADDVQVVDQPVLLAQPQPFGEEQEVELRRARRSARSARTTRTRCGCRPPGRSRRWCC